MLTRQNVHKAQLLLKQVRGLLEKAQTQIKQVDPALLKGSTVTPVDRARARLIAALEALSSDLSGPAMPSAEQVAIALQACEQLGATVPKIPVDFRIAVRDWQRVGAGLAVQLDDLADQLEQGKPEDRAVTVQLIANLVLTLIDPASLSGSVYRIADGSTDLSKIDAEYDAAAQRLEAVNQANLAAGGIRNPRELDEATQNFFRVAQLRKEARRRAGFCE